MSEKRDFEWHWKWQQGALFLKEENVAREWRKSIADFFYHSGRKDGFNEAVDKIVIELRSMDRHDEAEKVLKFKTQPTEAK